MEQLSRAIRDEAVRLGFDMVGLAPVRASDHERLYREWIAAGRHGEMAYLARTDAVQHRLQPDRRFRSAVVVALNYYQSQGEYSTDQGIIARYAHGRDYHKVIKAKLMQLLRFVEGSVGRELPLSRAYVDTGPVLERELAQRAGLGWFGRNTMMINPRRGSFFFLGTLLLDIELDYDAPFAGEHCGSCSACVTACPTNALLGRDEHGAPVMDATRCISYLTIEQRGPIPRELRPLIGNRIFGCDICQEVCPFTIRFSKATSDPSFAARAPGEAPFGVQLEADPPKLHPGTESPSLIALLETALDESAWDAFSHGSAIRRAGRAGFARNVCVALGNWASPDAVPGLVRALFDPEPLVRGHAAWALGEIASPESFAALETSLTTELEPMVLQEVGGALYRLRSRRISEAGRARSEAQ